MFAPGYSMVVNANNLNKNGSHVGAYPLRKTQLRQKLVALLEISDKILVVNVDHVKSSTLGQLRRQYRGRIRFMMGKNTLLRWVIRDYIRRTGRLEISSLLVHLRGNCGLLFFEGNPTVFDMINSQAEIIAASRSTAPARAGDIAPCDIILPPGDTGLEPTQTAFFHSMNIETRIRNGQIAIVNRVVVVPKGRRVNASHAALLHRLGICPFSYAIQPVALYDGGDCYPASVAAHTPQDLLGAFVGGMNTAASFSFGTGTDPTILTVPHSVCRAYAKLIALGIGAGLKEYSWPGLEQVRREIEHAARVGDHGDDDGDGGDENSDVGDFARTPSPSPPVNPFWPDTSDSEDDSSEEDESESA